MLRAQVKIVEILTLVDVVSTGAAERRSAGQKFCTFSIDMV